MKGAYVLLIKIEQPTSVKIRSLGEIEFEPGKWVYVGSAMGKGSTSLENRLSRHFRKEKTIHWHIDYLLDEEIKITKAMWAQSTVHIECELAQSLASSDVFSIGPKGFGAADCKKGCLAHVFKYQNGNQIDDVLTSVFVRFGLQPQTTINGVL